jgi:outer membrane immunogenic protein
VSWAGAHAGLSLGAAQSKLGIAYAATPIAGGGFSALGAGSIVTAGTGAIYSTGVIAGGQLGYDWQWGNLVAGGEIDVSFTDLGNARKAAVFAVQDNLHQSFRSNVLSTARGRIGYARDTWLAYATGGLAVADLRVRDTATSLAVGTAQSQSDKGLNGWTAGGGVQWMTAPGWSVKAEYLHADLGRLTDWHVFPGAPFAVSSHEHRLTEDLVRVGLDFHFH